MTPPLTPVTRRRVVGAATAALVALVAVAVAACGGSASAQSSSAGGGKLTLVAYSTPQSAFDAIIPLWQKTAAGKGWSFNESYGASGDQSRAVASGLPTDVVNFATTPDITRIVKAGLVSASWDNNP